MIFLCFSSSGFGVCSGSLGDALSRRFLNRAPPNSAQLSLFKAQRHVPYLTLRGALHFQGSTKFVGEKETIK